MKSGARAGKAEKIILALLEHGTIEKAAAALSVSDIHEGDTTISAGAAGGQI